MRELQNDIYSGAPQASLVEWIFYVMSEATLTSVGSLCVTQVGQPSKCRWAKRVQAQRCLCN